MTPEWYYGLIRDFLDRKIEAHEFESRYLAAFKAETGRMGRDLFLILDEIFGAVDSYWEECTPEEEDPPLTITEETLRTELSKDILKLRRYIEDQAATSGQEESCRPQKP